MELYLGPIELIKIAGKLIAHRYQQIQAATNDFKIINTTKGQVKGRKHKNVYNEFGLYYAFEGIPYAKPPLGELRFRAPLPPEPWPGVLNCLQYKSKPMQYNYISKRIEGSEDCLYLNVYVKKMNTFKPLPVMVWIHGGGYQIGEASRELYAPDYFMQRDVVFVSITYRLGIFGFLCLDDPELNIPGNAGLKDQVLALKWVKENIHNFNGDPNNITLFGESAGGASTQFMMLTPQTKGLFHKAIIQSGSVLCSWAYTDRHDWGFKYACHIGYQGHNNDKNVYEFLRSKSSKTLTFRDSSVMTKIEQIKRLMFLFCPVVEPYVTGECVISRPVKEMLANAWSNDIPLIVGANSSEGFLFHNFTLKYPFLIEELSDFVNLLPDDVQRSHSEVELKRMGLKLKEVYFKDQQPNIADHFIQYLELMGHRTFWHAVVRTIKARQKYAFQVPTYSYCFDFDSKFFNCFRILTSGRAARGVSHGDDLSYLFHNAISAKLSCNSKEFRCIQRMTGMWYSFALTSNPNCPEIQPVTWKPVAGDFTDSIKCLTISDNLEYKELPFYDKLSIWDEFYTKEELI